MNKRSSFFDQFWIRIFSAAIFIVFLFFAGCSGNEIFNVIFPDQSTEVEEIGSAVAAVETDMEGTPLSTEETGTAEVIATETTSVLETAVTTQEFTVEQSELVVWVPEEFSILEESSASSIFQQRIAEFERQNPGIVIVVRVKASNGSGSILDSLRNTKAAATTALPQVALLSRADMEDAVGLGLLLPLEEFFGSENSSAYFPFAHEIAELDGIRYGVPFVADVLVGIADNSLSDLDLTTWDEIRAKRIPLYFAANSPQATFFISQYLSTGGKLLDEQGHASFTDENLLTVLDSYEQNVSDKIFQESFNTLNTNEDVWALLEDGNAKWEINWYSKVMQSDLSELQVFQIPSLGEEPYTSAKGWLWTIVNKDEEVDETVAEFITFFSDQQFLADFTQASGYLPVLPASLSLYENTDLVERLSSILTAAHALPENSLVVELGPVFRDTTLMVLSQDYSSEEILETAQSQIEALQTK